MSIKRFCLALRSRDRSSFGRTLSIVRSLSASLLSRFVAKKAISLMDFCKVCCGDVGVCVNLSSDV